MHHLQPALEAHVVAQQLPFLICHPLYLGLVLQEFFLQLVAIPFEDGESAGTPTCNDQSAPHQEIRRVTDGYTTLFT